MWFSYFFITYFLIKAKSIVDLAFMYDYSNSY
jgi:hypothetical protein